MARAVGSAHGGDLSDRTPGCRFLSEDMTNGTFGHPWEQTLCIFGSSLLPELAPLLTSWLPVKRARS
ncbi:MULTISPECIES: DUF2716 domain-containing protein [unclassified Nonomuraea]|uniref:DUF2716 domain-containing protein n=1 Tax=unclassified Nonomuraea TaxID=2593643 RepID=UPI0033D68933